MRREDAGVPTPVLWVSLAASAYAWAVFSWNFVHPGLIGYDFGGPGTDWMVFYSAARAVLAGQKAVLFEGDRFTEYLNTGMASWLSAPLPYRPWVNPPIFLFLLVPLSGLGFLGSYLVFQGLSAAALAWALAGIDSRRDRQMSLAVIISPAAAITAIQGQSAMLVAALLVGGLRLAPARPVLAGALLAVLTFKPQFWMYVPVALVGARHYRCLLAAFVGAGLLAVASALTFGIDHWIWWFGQAAGGLTDPGSKWVEYGRLWGNSVSTCAVLLGLPPPVPSLLQGLATLGSAVAVFVAYRSALPANRKLAAFLVATLLGAPHSGFYDTILAVVAAALWLGGTRLREDDMRPWIVALVLWLAPLLMPPAIVPIGRLFPIVLAVFLAGLLMPIRSPRAITGVA